MDDSQQLDIGEVTLVWGDPTTAKAELREESRLRHLERPIGERLAAALELVLSHDEPA